MKCIPICGVLVLLVAALIAVGKNAAVSRGMLPVLVNEVKLLHSDIPDLSKKTIIVTGANAGLGKSSAKYLAMNGATVIMGCRSMQRCAGAKQEILSEWKMANEKVDAKNLVPTELDLGDLSSVKAFAQRFNRNYKTLDSLMLNAGVMHPPFTLTKDGFESQFGVNHLGHFYLTQLLLPTLEQTAKLKSEDAVTVVVVSSNAHFLSYPEGVKLAVSDLNNAEAYDHNNAYGQSKLCNVLFTQELAPRLEKKGILVNSLNPGTVNTELTRHYPELVQKIIKGIMGTFPNKILFESDYAALTQIYLAVSPDIISRKVTGKYFVPVGEQADTATMAKNMTLQKGLWELTEQILKDKGFKY